MLPPDIMLVGLDITVDALRTAGLVDRASPSTRRRRGSAVRKPISSPRGALLDVRADGAGPTGATVAKDRLENPTRIAFEAGDFLPPRS